MDTISSFFKNRWTKLGFSVLSPGYAVFLGFLAWLVFTHYLVPANPASLFSLYLFINVMFGVVMVYTRKQVLTQISACFLHPCIMVALFFAFGNWFLLVPPFVIATVVFFASGAGESLKTVLGTIYLILFVIGVLGYLTLQTFTISIFDIDLKQRSDDYLYSPDKTYRLVKYIDEASKENRMVKYYIEPAVYDISLPFLDCERIYGFGDGERSVLSARYGSEPEIRWLSDSRLYIDGTVKEFSLEALASAGSVTEAEEEDDFSGETAILTSSVSMTKVSQIASQTTPEEGGN